MPFKKCEKRIGTCELCGGHSRELRILVLTDFIGWTCPECFKDLQYCMERRFVNAGEMTEPAE